MQLQPYRLHLSPFRFSSLWQKASKILGRSVIREEVYSIICCSTLPNSKHNSGSCFDRYVFYVFCNHFLNSCTLLGNTGTLLAFQNPSVMNSSSHCVRFISSCFYEAGIPCLHLTTLGSHP